MPISPIVLQRRHAELGRIRLGAKRNGNGAPMKLEAIRFTSPSEGYIRDLAELYGGTPLKWDNNGKAEWEVYTTATSIPVVAVKGGLSQWMETWSGGGCVHRCDGIVNVLTGEQCDERDPQHKAAKPTTRLSVMLPELDAIGVWRMESHGWNAAAEIPAVAELAQYVGDLVPAVLHLVERRAVKDGKTSRFVVPVLDLRIGQARLREIVAAVSGGESLELASAPATSAPAIEAPKAAPAQDLPTGTEEPVRIPTPQQIANATLDEATKMLAYLDERLGEHPATMAARDRIAALTAAPVQQPDADTDGVVDAEIVPEQQPAAAAPPPPTTEQPDADAVWFQIVKVAGEKGMSTPDLEDDFRLAMGMGSNEASGAELAVYLHTLTTGEQPKGQVA